MELADIKLIAFVDTFGVNTSAFVFDAVCGIEVFDVVGTVFEDDGAMFTRDIAVADDEIGEL